MVRNFAKEFKGKGLHSLSVYQISQPAAADFFLRKFWYAWAYLKNPTVIRQHTYHLCHGPLHQIGFFGTKPYLHLHITSKCSWDECRASSCNTKDSEVHCLMKVSLSAVASAVAPDEWDWCCIVCGCTVHWRQQRGVFRWKMLAPHR